MRSNVCFVCVSKSACLCGCLKAWCECSNDSSCRICYTHTMQHQLYYMHRHCHVCKTWAHCTFVCSDHTETPSVDVAASFIGSRWIWLVRCTNRQIWIILLSLGKECNLCWYSYCILLHDNPEWRGLGKNGRLLWTRSWTSMFHKMRGIAWENSSIKRINLHGAIYSDIILSSQIIIISAGIFISRACLLCWILLLVCHNTEVNGSEDNILCSDIIGIENTSHKKLFQAEGSRVVSTPERHQYVKKTSAL